MWWIPTISPILNKQQIPTIFSIFEYAVETHHIAIFLYQVVDTHCLANLSNRQIPTISQTSDNVVDTHHISYFLICGGDPPYHQFFHHAVDTYHIAHFWIPTISPNFK